MGVMPPLDKSVRLNVRFDEFYGSPDNLARSLSIIKHIKPVPSFGVIAEVYCYGLASPNL
jgi:hypothetical protein